MVRRSRPGFGTSSQLYPCPQYPGRDNIEFTHSCRGSSPSRLLWTDTLKFRLTTQTSPKYPVLDVELLCFPFVSFGGGGRVCE